MKNIRNEKSTKESAAHDVEGNIGVVERIGGVSKRLKIGIGL